jgi:hypothetical protein
MPVCRRRQNFSSYGSLFSSSTLVSRFSPYFLTYSSTAYTANPTLEGVIKTVVDDTLGRSSCDVTSYRKLAVLPFFLVWWESVDEDALVEVGGCVLKATLLAVNFSCMDHGLVWVSFAGVVWFNHGPAGERILTVPL